MDEEMDRRQEVRFGADQPVAVSVNGHAIDAGVPGKIAGASKSGLRILMQTPVELNTTVTVRWDHGSLTGEVRHCRCVKPGQYSIGVRITEVMQPSKLRTEQLETAYE